MHSTIENRKIKAQNRDLINGTSKKKNSLKMFQCLFDMIELKERLKWDYSWFHY